MLADALADAAVDWLSATGEEGVYSSSSSGTTDMTVTIERDVDAVDDRGMMAHVTTATFMSGQVSPQRGDTITIGPVIWRVEGLVDNPGHLVRVSVSRAPA